MYQPALSKTEPVEDEPKPTTSRITRLSTANGKAPEPSKIGLGRTRSLRQPSTSTTTSTRPTQPTGSSAHSRTKSTTTTTSLRKDGASARTYAERPKSLHLPLGCTMKPNPALTESISTVQRASARLAAQSRIGRAKPKPEASQGGLGTRSAARPEESVAGPARRKEPVKEEPAKAARPAFSTLQQHFTPRKTGKAPTSTFLHPAPAPTSSSLPPELVTLQSELLQLHLLHDASAQVERQWAHSAKRSLHKKFEEVASLYQAMLDYERTGQEQKNLQALIEWSTGNPSAGLIEYIQVLSGPLHELPSLVEPGGRYHRIIDDFERWMLWVEETQSSRRSAANTSGNSVSIESLGDSWKAETAAMTRKVTSYARDLEILDQPTPGSSIAIIVDTCRALLQGIVEELQVMQAIEADIVGKEKDWVEARLQAIAQDVQIPLVGDGEAAAWRS